MIIKRIKQSDITDKPLFYSRWHSCSSAELGPHIDINVGGLVGPILSMGADTFIITIYLTELIDLKDDYVMNENGFKIWNISAGTMVLKNMEEIIQICMRKIK